MIPRAKAPAGERIRTPPDTSGGVSGRSLLALLAEDVAQGVADLAERGVALDRGQDARQPIRGAGGAPVKRGGRRADNGVVAPGPQLCQLRRLPPAQLRVHAQDRWLDLAMALTLELVHANHDRVLLVQLTLEGEGRL